MAEMAVSFAREKLLPLITDEANLLWGIPKELVIIKKELEYIQAFLKDADKRAIEEGDNTTEGIKIWVKDLREASFRIEDVIDEYILYVEQQPDAFGCTALFFECDATHFIESLKHRHQIASKIQQIKSILDGIKQRSKDYHFQIQPYVQQGYRGSNSQWGDPRLRSRYLTDAEVVGFEGPRDELIRQLVEGPIERTVISVVGMGGQGKTTLASRVFNNQKVIGHFKSLAWITVSQSYTVEELMKNLLNNLCKEENPHQAISEIDRDSLINKLRNYLCEKRYVVIFDDVWSVELWGQIECALLDNRNGSRILITTRKKDVVESFKSSHFDHVHELKPLNFEDSMKLFCKKTFWFDYDGHCPEHLMDISIEFVKKCKGLPLAIVAISGLLSCKEKTTFEWEKIRQSLTSEIEKNHQLIGVAKILGFSYDDLPYNLKSCLLYFGMYPEDYNVKSTRLIRQWIAEGFVKDEEGKTLEDIAQQYLTELIGRSLVQVSSFSIDGKAKSCHVHDLIRDMILIKFKDLSFCQHISKRDELMPNEMVRRLSITKISNNLTRDTQSSHIRSLLVLTGQQSTLSTKFLKKIPTNFKLLKVFEFQENLPLSSIPENWENLIHLKYLSFKKTSILSPSIPKFIGKLQNLETLDIRNAYFRFERNRVFKIPKDICKLKKLRHLLGYSMGISELKDNLGDMTSLQTLCQISVVDDEEELIKELGKLKQLRNLGLTCLKKQNGSALCSSINEMQNLEKLDIQSTLTNEVLDLTNISSLPMLRKLRLDGRLNQVPKWVSQLQNLVEISLTFSNLNEDPLKSLQNLPHLLFLCIGVDAYLGESLHFQDGGFQKLKELQLNHLYKLNSVIFVKGALHSLEKLQLWRLIELKKVPTGIQHLKKLEVLHLRDSPKEFEHSIAADGGPEHPSIQHVTLVEITGYQQNPRIIHHSRR